MVARERQSSGNPVLLVMVGGMVVGALTVSPVVARLQRSYRPAPRMQSSRGPDPLGIGAGATAFLPPYQKGYRDAVVIAASDCMECSTDSVATHLAEASISKRVILIVPAESEGDLTGLRNRLPSVEILRAERPLSAPFLPRYFVLDGREVVTRLQDEPMAASGLVKAALGDGDGK